MSPVRVLHTADWHVGKTLRRMSRYDEMRAVLDEIVGLAVERDADVVVVAGDVYDHKNPSAEAEGVVYDALLALVRAGKEVVLVPGNHDNPAKWRAIRPLLDRFAIHVVPRVRRPEEGGVLTLTPEGADAPLQVACLPWVGKHRYVGAQELMRPDEEPHTAYNDGLGRVMAALTDGMDPEACTMLCGHMHVDGARIGGGERTLTIGQVYAVAPQHLPAVQYAALGHLHRPQRIADAPAPTRYAGSPLKFDFGETGYANSVTLVELVPGRPARIEEVELASGRDLIHVTGTLEELEARADALGDAHLKVTLRCDRPDHDLGDAVRQVLPNALEVRLDYPREEGVREGSLRDLTVREQYTRYYHATHGVEPEEEELQLLEELLGEVGTGGGS